MASEEILRRLARWLEYTGLAETTVSHRVFGDQLRIRRLAAGTAWYPEADITILSDWLTAHPAETWGTRRRLGRVARKTAHSPSNS